MAAKKDPLAGKVSLQAKIDEAGLKASAKSRTIVALDRLCGGLLDIPGSFFDGLAQRIRLKNTIKDELIALEGGAAKQKLGDFSGLGDRLINSFLSEAMQKQFNRASVARETIENLKTLPPPVSDDNGVQLDDDWLGMLSDHAGRANTDRVRETWGQVLAGEIREPGSFSKSTLRVLSELDKKTAQDFQSIASQRLEINLVPRPDELAGDKLFELIALEEAGLLQDVNGFLGMDVECSDSGFGYVMNKSFALRIRPRTGTTIRLSLLKITRAGREIASIFPIQSGDIALRSAASSLRKNAVSMQLCEIHTLKKDGNFEFSIVEDLT